MNYTYSLAAGQTETDSEKNEKGSETQAPAPIVRKSALAEDVERHPIEGAWIEPKNLWIIIRYRAVPFIKHLLTYGSSVDIHAMQVKQQSDADARHIADVHARARQYVQQ